MEDLDRRILDMESRTFRFQGVKERAIREQLGLSRTAYYVRLNSLLDDAGALEYAPVTVNRLRRLRNTSDGKC